MPVPPKSSVQPILDRYQKPIAEAVIGGWNDWRQSPYVGVWRCKRSRANFVWEQIIERAHLALDGTPGVRIIEGHETFQFLLEDRVLFRFKKGDDVGLTANVPTQIALAFHDHERDLFGLPEVHRVEVIYKLNKLETEVVDVLVVARDGDTVVWTHSLLQADQDVVPLPLQPADEEQPAASSQRLIRPKTGSQTPDRKRQN